MVTALGLRLGVEGTTEKGEANILCLERSPSGCFEVDDRLLKPKIGCNGEANCPEDDRKDCKGDSKKRRCPSGTLSRRLEGKEGDVKDIFDNRDGVIIAFPCLSGVVFFAGVLKGALDIG